MAISADRGQPATRNPQPPTSSWTYARLTIIDGDRRLKPSSVCFDFITFPHPPRIASARIEIILTNADDEQRATAVVLPNDPQDTRIPIRLV